MQWNLGRNILIGSENGNYYLELFKWRDSCRFTFCSGWMAGAIFDVLRGHGVKEELPLWEFEIRDLAGRKLKINSDNEIISLKWICEDWNEIAVIYSLNDIEDRVRHGLATILLCDHKSWFCLLDKPNTPSRKTNY